MAAVTTDTLAEEGGACPGLLTFSLDSAHIQGSPLGLFDCLNSGLPLGVMVMSQPKLPLRATSKSVATQWQGWCPWLILLLENTGMSLARAAIMVRVDV